MKFLLRIILVTTMALGGVGGYSMTIGRDTLIGKQARTVVWKIQERIGSAVPNFKNLNLKSSASAPAETYEPVLTACLEAIFFENGGHHFSQSKWGARPVPYQFRGLEVIGPEEMPLNGADRARGIERRLNFELYVEAFRTYDKADGWGAWNVGVAPNLDNITLVLHAGTWKVASSPRQSYSLK